MNFEDLFVFPSKHFIFQISNTDISSFICRQATHAFIIITKVTVNKRWNANKLLVCFILCNTSYYCYLSNCHPPNTTRNRLGTLIPPPPL